MSSELCVSVRTVVWCVACLLSKWKYFHCTLTWQQTNCHAENHTHWHKSECTHTYNTSVLMDLMTGSLQNFWDRRQAPTLLSDFGVGVGLGVAALTSQNSRPAVLCSTLTCSFVWLPSGACSDHVTDTPQQHTGAQLIVTICLWLFPCLTIWFQCLLACLPKSIELSKAHRIAY